MIKNILVTGSSGYVGGSFVKAYKDNYNFVTFSPLRNSLDELELHNVDAVVHCAALVHQKVEYTYERYYEINVQYPLDLANKAKKSGVKQFIFISTIAVYGDAQELITEHTPCNPVTPYGKSKLEAEKKLQALCDEDFLVCIVRLPMVYGADAPGNIATLISLVKKLPLLPLADINNKRTFLYIENLLCFLELLIEKQVKGVMLIGDDESISTTQLIRSIAKALENRTFLFKIPLFESLLKRVKPSIHKKLYTSLEVDSQHTKKTTEFNTPHGVEEAIKLMIKGTPQ